MNELMYRPTMQCDTIVFIHSFGHFYSAPSSPPPLRGAPDSTDTVSEFHAEAHRQLRAKDLPKVSTWRLERESNPRPFGRQASTQSMSHRAPTLSCSWMKLCQWRLK